MAKKERCPSIGIVNWDHIYDRDHLKPNERVIGGIGIDSDNGLFISDDKGNRWTFNPAVMAECKPLMKAREFATNDLVQMPSEGLLVPKEALGKIALIKEKKRNEIGEIEISVCGYDVLIHGFSLALLNQDYIARLFKEHFEAYKPGNRHEEFVKAVQNGDTKTVYEHLKTAYRHAHEDELHFCKYTLIEDDGPHLDPNRDIFILVSDSTLKDFGGEIEFRAKFQNEIAIELLRRNQTDSAVIIPVMNIVVGYDNDAAFPSVLPAQDVFTNSWVIRCEGDWHVRPDHYIHPSMLPEEVATAHIRHAWKAHMKSQTRWANRCKELCKTMKLARTPTYARDDEDDYHADRYHADRDHADYSNVITSALCENRIDIVTHFGEIETSFLTNCLIKRSDFVEWSHRVDNGGLLNSLQVQFKDPHTNKDKNHIKQILGTLATRPVQSESNFPVIHENDWWKSWKYEKRSKDKPTLPWWNYIFLWCILLRQHEMAKVVLQKVENPTAMALVAYHLCHSTKRLSKSKEIEAAMEHDMVEWLRLATGTLHEFCSLHPAAFEESRIDGACELLLTPIPFWDNATCLELAIESQNLAFVESPLCQYTMNIIWLGDLLNISSFQFAMYLLFPFLVRIKKRCSSLWSFLDAPKTKFAYNVMMYVAFLILYAYVILFGLARTVSTCEYALMTWVLSMLVEEIRQVATATDKMMHIKSGWNVIDFISIALFLTGFGLRFIHFPDVFDAPRVVFSVDFGAFVLRLIHIFSVHKVLGPKLIMIGKMFQDLLYFLLILSVFFVSYAISSHAILYPNSPATWDTARQILSRPYWHLYGELFLEETEGLTDCTNNASLWTNGTYQRCPSETGKMIVPILMGFYLLFANILLLSLLIALFSYTVNEIHQKSDSLWCFQRYFLIKEYAMRPLFCPPFNCLWHMFELLLRIKGITYETNNCFRREMRPYNRSYSHRREQEALKTTVDQMDNKNVLDEAKIEELGRSMAAQLNEMVYQKHEHLRHLIHNEFIDMRHSIDALRRTVAKLKTKAEEH